MVPLLFIAVTGINMAWVPAKEPKKNPGVADGIAASSGVYDSAVSQAWHGGPVEVLRVTLPKDSTGVLVVSIRYQTNSLRRQTTFTFDQYSAKLLATDRWERKSLKQRFWGSSYEIHTGRVWGTPGKTIMFSASLVAGSLPVTGFLIWKRKRRKGTTKSGQAALA